MMTLSLTQMVMREYQRFKQKELIEIPSVQTSILSKFEQGSKVNL